MSIKHDDPSTGVLTLAIPKDFKKAIALALTLREHSSDLPISVVCPSSLKDKLQPYFDRVIIERNDLRGFEHKLFLDEYSPYKNTFFFDSDILIIKDIIPTIQEWSGNAYAVRGRLENDTKSSFGLDRNYVLGLINKENFSVIDGAGHAYFEKPACKKVFDTARDILKDYSIYRANKFADEDAMGIAMTMLDIAPKENNGFLGSPWCAINHSFVIDTDRSRCHYDDLIYGKVEPIIVHFPRFVYPLTYARELIKTYKRNNIRISGIWTQAIKELFTVKILWPLLKLRRKMLKLMKVDA